MNTGHWLNHPWRGCGAAWILYTSMMLAADPPLPPTASGPFQPDLDSLRQYQCPDWFRDAKLGIWAHWGPQAVPMVGDWYARHLYVQDHPQNKHHLANYGHPSRFGYKDIIPLWKAEQWDPDRLMALYKRAGARYFVSMGVHHDNFDLWNSRYQKWNAVNLGPRRDVVGDWQRAAREQGLRFGVSEHLGASFTWFQDSHKADKQGPQAGVPYDGANPQYQDLYHFAADPDDKGWYSTNPRWQQMWFQRIRDLVDSYRPDLLYTDGAVPFGNEVGRSLIAHYYNSDTRRRSTRPQVVYTCKQKSEGRWIEDLERGVMSGINPHPWQTDTSIGDWYYNKNWKFRPVQWVIHMLADIVSKNGNLLINVVQRPDGSLNPEVEQTLQDMAGWIALNGEAIYGTRPWQIYGEGPVRARGGHFKEDFAYGHQDIRFTTEGRTLYALALGWPEDGRLLIRSLAEVPGARSNRISRIQLLGHSAKLDFTQTTNGLEVRLPAAKPCDHAVTLKIAGRDLTAISFITPAPPIKAAADGSLKLEADTAELDGTLRVESRGSQSNIGFWDNSSDLASWSRVEFQAGSYELSALVSTLHPEAQFTVEVAGETRSAAAPNTGDWGKFQAVTLGVVRIPKAGLLPVKCRAREGHPWKAINLVRLTFRPVP